MRMVWPAIAIAGGIGCGPALAADVKVTPIIDARLRYEHVDQDGIDREADAVTARVRAGAEASAGDWAVLAEAEGTLAIDEDYNSGVNGRTAYPLVADPQNVEINRLQLQYRGLKGLTATLGRQSINLADQRFVGGVAWRQNEQTYDAARVEWAITPKLKADMTYSWSVRTIWGVDGAGARQQAISGDNVFAMLGWKTPVGTLSGFAFLIDQDEAAVSGFGLSSQTYGGRLQGARPLGSKVKLDYALSYARQSGWHRNPNDYAADYWLADAGLTMAGWRIGGGYEVLGADGGAALTSFQTPLATAHKFQGWADKFLTTPPNGVRDLYASVGKSWAGLAGADAVSVQAIYHRFDSDRQDQHYGNEIDLQATARFGRITLLAKYADYDAKAFMTDTRKAWLSIEWVY
nr:alginate export family protein [Sphingomonas laterariae]